MNALGSRWSTFAPSLPSLGFVGGREAKSQDEVLIALMGPTGSGKSTFIKRVTEIEEIKIGEGLTAETAKCTAYPFEYKGVKFSLVDTPGTNDTNLDDATILAELAAFMETSYRANSRFTAIIYLHPITDDRMEGSKMDNLAMFQRLCGPEFHSNVFLATSMWSNVNKKVGALRERELKRRPDFWGDMIRNGSSVVRLPDTRPACIKLLLRCSRKRAKTLQIQWELITKGMSVADTAAGKASRAAKALEALQRDAINRLTALAEDNKGKLKAQQQKAAEDRKKQQEAFEADLQKEKKKDEQLRKEHEEASRRQAAEHERQLKVEKEKAEKTRVETEIAKFAATRLTIDLVQSETRHRYTGPTQRARLRKQVHNDRDKLLDRIYEFAKQASNRQIKIHSSWYKVLKIGIACDVCGKSLDSSVSYYCGECEDFRACKTCYLSEERCLEDEHTSWPRSSKIGTEAGKCLRTQCLSSANNSLTCDACREYVDGAFFHCCKCRSDNYDLCLSCAVLGKTCLNKSHVLQMLYA